MSDKAGHGETTKPYARRDPDDMVKAKPLEPQCPNLKQAGPDTVGEIRCPLDGRSVRLTGDERWW